jgi:hypothetical protein
MSVTMDDTMFTVQNINVFLTKQHAYGGLGDVLMHVDSNGIAMIKAHDFKMIIDVVQSDGNTSTPSRLNVDNDKDLQPTIDYANKKWSIPSIPFDTLQGITGDFALAGRITNQPPHARTTTLPPLECTSPAGAIANLDGSPTTDADGNFAFFSWSTGPGLDDKNVFAKTKTASPVAPFGTTLYTLAAGDSFFQAAFASTNVTVQDTTPPVLILGTPQPDCLWAPNHKLVLYDLGKQLPFTIKDTCDLNPTVQISGVTSNQPDVGGGQGNFTPDILKGAKALCLRSERQGTVMWDRQYTITVQATDAHNNATTKAVVVTVPHDQSSAAKCPLIDPSRFVDENDPRCTAN